MFRNSFKQRERSEFRRIRSKIEKAPSFAYLKSGSKNILQTPDVSSYLRTLSLEYNCPSAYKMFNPLVLATYTCIFARVHMYSFHMIVYIKVRMAFCTTTHHLNTNPTYFLQVLECELNDYNPHFVTIN